MRSGKSKTEIAYLSCHPRDSSWRGADTQDLGRQVAWGVGGEESLVRAVQAKSMVALRASTGDPDRETFPMGGCQTDLGGNDSHELRLSCTLYYDGL